MKKAIIGRPVQYFHKGKLTPFAAIITSINEGNNVNLFSYHGVVGNQYVNEIAHKSDVDKDKPGSYWDFLPAD